MADGGFTLGGAPYFYDIIEIQCESGEDYSGGDMADHIHEADHVFYSVEDQTGEVYYRWLAGPYESLEDLEDAIADETDAYE